MTAIPTTRLVDYFAVITLDDSKERNGVSVGKILQRFPGSDWPDVPFFPGLELFCQPQGWKLSAKKLLPTFFISVLTDIGADRHFVACLSFHEPKFSSENGASALNDVEDDDEIVNTGSTTVASPDAQIRSIVSAPVLYCPKCLVLVSRHEYFEVFRNCLGTIFAVYIDKLPYDIESLVATLVSGIQVPPAGGPQVKFSLGANDRQAIQPPVSSTVPVTQNCIALLFQQLGIFNVLCLFCACLTDRKILFISQSYTRLTDACHALSSLIYPLKYSYVYVPLLPGSLIEVLHSPTPFIMGLHTSFKSQISELFEVITVDVDCGSVYIPDAITVPLLPEPYHSRLLTCLTLVLNRELFTADCAFSSNTGRNVPLQILDKQTRACFLRFFADLFTDYRACLRVIRIHPKPFITFHKAAFLGLRCYQDDDFMNRLIDSMSFQTFVADRGVPYRVCDLFDDVCATIERTLQDENDNVDKIIDNIVMLAQQMQDNECPNNQPFMHKVPTPTDSAMNNLVQATFPFLDGAKINNLIDENISKLPPNLYFNSGNQWCRMAQLREVPFCHKRPKYLKSQFSGNIRRLDVLKHCLRCIFENKISDARKMLSAVLLSMKSSVVRVAFCQELYSSLHPQNRACLEPQQFDLFVRLMNCALQNDTVADEYGVAYAMLTLATTYCRRLSTGVMQFAYTCIQDHGVWKNQQFWESSFYHDVHLQLRDLYAGVDAKKSATPFGSSPSRDVWNLYEDPCVLKLMADKIKSSAWLNTAEVADLKNQEEAIIYSQAIHYANRIVYFLVPMDANRLRRVNVQSLEDSSNASVSNVSRRSGDDVSSTTESDVESGFIEGEAGAGDLGHGTVRYISKFLDKVCCEAGVSADKLRQLHQMISGVVAMHIETLEHVHKESKKLPPIHKPKMLVPAFLPGEQMLQGYLRVYLLADGRVDIQKSVEKTHSTSFLPAEGAIFLTNYRIIFKGQPCDPFICDKVVMRVIPVMAVTKEKRIGQQYLTGAEPGGQSLHDALQIRSATFQLMKVAFDEEVSSDKVQNFCQALEQLRWPEEINQLFALSFGANTLSPSVLNPAILPKDKGGTIKGMAKTVWKKTAQKAGLSKPKPKPKTLPLQSVSSIKSSTYASQTSSPKRLSPASDEDSERHTPTHERPSTDFTFHQNKLPLTRTLDRLSERSYCQDFQRLGLCSRVDVTLHSGGMSGGTLNKPLTRSNDSAFRLTVVNRNYAVCRSYPAVVVVPTKISDDSMKKIAKGHKHGRFPVVTWCSDRGALLVRGAGFHIRSVVSRLKQQAAYQTNHSSGAGGGSSQQPALKSSVEQERYFSYLVSISPNPPLNAASHLSPSMGSLLSLDSLLLANFDTTSIGSSTPDTYRKPLSGVGQFQKAMGMRSSGGVGQQKTMTMRLGFKPAHARNASSQSAATLSATPRLASANQKRLSTVSSDLSYSSYKDAGVTQALHRASLYIFGEKSQAKTLKLDHKCEFIPVDFPEAHDAKEALKKLLRVTAPSIPPSNENASYTHLKALDESGWLQQIKALLQISNAIVDIVDLQNSSVAVCLEYGWDATTQIVSLAQIMLDPFYRTLDGFRILIEKEWLSFGHRFSHRCNHTFASSASGFAPIFLQFLDAVHQICSQYPSAFEFNDFYLRFLAYHSTVAYFRTFIMDSEADRVESGLIQFDSKPRPRPEVQYVADDVTGGAVDSPMMKRSSLGRHSALPITSVWEYIAEKHRRSCTFYNFTYAPTSRSRILRPQFSLAALDLWDYYVTDPLSHGSTYDLEVADTELLERQTDQSEMTDSSSFTNPTRRLIDVNYDSIDFTEPNIFKSVLDEINNVERELDVLPQHWEQILYKIRQALEHNEEESAQISATGEWARWLSRAWHKKSTIELLLRGRLASRSSGQGQRASQADNGEQHNFQKYNFTTPEHCHVCNRVLWGIMKQGLRCTVCEFSCHEKCVSVAPHNCSSTKIGLQKSPQNSAAHLSIADNQSANERLSEENFNDFVSQPVETRTHEGYLMKRGALLKAWKQRWFVLDSIKHQLRYYDAMEDSHCKGYIDLAEVINIGQATAPPGSPKQLEGAFFDLRTPRRVYNFLANNQRDAQEWIEKIQACLQ